MKKLLLILKKNCGQWLQIQRWFLSWLRNAAGLQLNLTCSHLILLTLLLLGTTNLQAQAPQQFSFQGVARDAAGKAIANKTVKLRLTIQEMTDLGNADISQETHQVQTSAAGIFNVNVGSGGIDMNLMKWDRKKYGLHVEMDPAGGNNYTELGLTQLLSVPYSLFANEAAKWKDGIPVVIVGNPIGQPSVTLPAVGSGSRIIWDPLNSAFRVGASLNGKWEPEKIGPYSFATGSGTEASGSQSTAMGSGSSATHTYTVAVGANASAINERAFSLGSNTVASGKSAVAIGSSAVAKSVEGISLGAFNSISDNPDPNLVQDTDRLFQVGRGKTENTRLNALTILRNGNTGIGDNVLAPEYLLDLGGRMRIRHVGAAGALTAGIHLNNSQNELGSFIGMKTDQQVGFYVGGQWRFWVADNGNGYLNGNIIQTSDQRLKTNVTSIHHSLSKVSGLQAHHYHWKDASRDQSLQTGLIAQEVEKIFPELVTTDKEGFKAVNYIGLIPHLIESVKELKDQNEEIVQLRKQVAQLSEVTKRFEAMEASLKNNTVNITQATSK